VLQFQTIVNKFQDFKGYVWENVTWFVDETSLEVVDVAGRLTATLEAQLSGVGRKEPW
jgi:hypothetical protein